MHVSKVMLYIKKRDEWMDERTDGQTDGRTNDPEAKCPSNFFKVGDIITSTVLILCFLTDRRA